MWPDRVDGMANSADQIAPLGVLCRSARLIRTCLSLLRFFTVSSKATSY